MAEDLIGLRLRAERLRRRITLESIAVTTKISVGLLKDLERDDVSRWPAGIFRRSFIRSYAKAVGLDPDETLADFLKQHPDASPASRGTSEAVGEKVADGVAHLKTTLRLTLANMPEPFAGGQLLRATRPRLAAAAWDAAMTFGMAGLAYLLVDSFWAPFGLGACCYYLGGILILGNTPGVCLFAPRSHDDPPPSVPREEDRLADLAASSALERSFIR
jgi:transcriptional regulator with XRE-family HTH domain